MRIIRFTFMALLLLPIGLTAAQYRNDRGWNDQRYGDSRRLNNISRTLSNRADALWNMVRNRSEFRSPQNAYLRDSVRDFAREARQHESNPSDWNARRLIERAEDINRFVGRTRLPYDFRNNWFGVEQQVTQLSRYYGLPFDGSRNLARTDPYDDRYGGGTFRWRGRVDGTDIIYIQGSQVRIDHRAARPITDSSFDLRSPLPRSSVNLRLDRIQGRGRVQVIEQPSPANNFTAAVLIEDNDAGSDFYEFALRW